MARPKVFIACAQCGSEKQRRRASTRFCSRRCARLHLGTPKGVPNAGKFGSRPAWNRGMVGVRVGEKRSAETRRRISESLRGENAPNWRGGISTENECFRGRADYAEWRRQVFARDNYTCQECGARSAAGQRVRLNADHIKPFASHPELRLVLDNGRTLCDPCHRKTPTYGNGGKLAGSAFTGQKAKKVGEAVPA